MASPVRRPAPHKWLFSEEEMRNAASIREGMSREEELSHRQLGTAFIQEMVDGLNMIRDPKMRINHTGLCIAHIYMHRFYYWHSFQKFDYRDVGAACILLAGKACECPRKLMFVITVWREKNDRKQLQTDAAKAEAAQIIVLLESMLLQTISFDLNVELPHTAILDLMKNAEKDTRNRALTTCAYYFATDVLAVTDWCLRYSMASITIAVIKISAVYANVKVETLFTETPDTWYAHIDSTMTDEKLKKMQLEFLKTYQATCTFHHASKHIADFRNESSDLMARKMERSRDGRSNSPMVHHNVPDSTVNGVRPRGYVPKDELTVERLNKERVHEEERRKRDHDRMSGRIDNSSSSEKRARIDPISTNFVSSSSSSMNPSNGKHMAPPLSTTSSNSRNSSSRRPPEKPFVNSTTVASPFRHSARTFDVAPMLTPPIAPKLASAENSDMDLEDGELE